MISGIFLHDPVSFVAVVRPDLFTYKKGVVRVETQGISVGHTLMDQGLKRYVQLPLLSILKKMFPIGTYRTGFDL